MSKYEFAIVAALVAAFAGALLMRTPHLQEETERLEVEQTVRNIRVGIQHAVGEHIINGQEYRIAEVAGMNPVELLDHDPPGYNSKVRRAQIVGEWAYDGESRVLSYQPRFPHVFAGERELRWLYSLIVDSAGHPVAIHLVTLN